MIRRILLSGFGALLLTIGGVAQADSVLYDSCINVDGTLSNTGVGGDCSDPDGGGQTGLGADGLGTVSVSVSGAGDHTVIGYFDLEVDEDTNTFFNETGSTMGTLAAGQSWEIDEPGFGNADFYFGDIFFNMADSDDTTGSLLDGLIFFDAIDNWTLTDASGADIDDVSVALGWDFTLGVGETADISFTIASTPPTGGFFLIQTDLGSDMSVFFSSTLEITGGQVPEPGTLLLLGAGLLGMGLGRRRKTH